MAPKKSKKNDKGLFDWLYKKTTSNSKKRQPAPKPFSVFPSRYLHVADASDIIAKISDPVTKEHLQTVVNVYMDWSRTGNVQKLAGVDVLLVQTSEIISRISYRIKVESGAKYGRGHHHVVDILHILLEGIEYINVKH
jgi:hypothetical protein